MPDFIKSELDKRSKEHAVRTLKIEEGIDFSSNDFFGISNNPEVKTAFLTRLNEDGQIGAKGSRLLSGNTKNHLNFEEKLASFFQAPSALLYGSGYVANLGLISCVAGRNDLILVDEKVHASIKDGIRLSFAKNISFRHNKINDLERKLKTAGKYQNIYVIVESLYSMDGDFADLENISAICKKNGVHLIVDEAHSTGVYENGKGYTAMLGLEEEVFARIFTFGKAFGGNGAAIVGSKELKEYLVNFSRPFIYSTAPNLVTVYHLESALDYIQNHFHTLRNKLQHNIDLFKSLIPSSSDSHIQPVVLGDVDQVKQLSFVLLDKGYIVKPILAPTVPKGKERLRICLHTFNTEEQIRELAGVISAYKK